MRFLTLAVAVIAIMALASTAMAGEDVIGKLSYTEGIEMGPVNLHVGLRLKAQHNNNIYSKPRDEKSDYIGVASPGIVLGVQTQRNKLELGYSPDVYRYKEYDDENYVSQTAKASYTLKSLAGLTLKANYKYFTSKDPRPEQSTPSRKLNQTHTSDVSVKYDFPASKLSAEVFVNDFLLKYDKSEDEELNREDLKSGAGLYYKILPKTALLVEYSLETRDYIDSADEGTDQDSTLSTWSLGVRWDATARMNGALKVGWQKRDYASAIYNGSERSRIAADTYLNYNITETTDLKVSFAQSINEATFAGNATENISGGANYIHKQVGFGISSKFFNRLTASLNLGMERDDYDTLDKTKKARQDEISSVNASLEYDFEKNFSGLVSAQVKEKDSNDPENQEKNTIITMAFTYAI